MKEKIARWTGFFVLWGLVGFALGTATLLGPVRWLTGVVRWLGATPTVESVAVNGVIVSFVLASFLVALYLGRWILRTERAGIRFGVPATTAGLAAAALWLWFSPGAMTRAGPPPREPEAPFTIGPYPDRHRMNQLRAAGYTGVISLLHPAVVPFEPRLLEDEREHAREAGLEFIHAPMLPWVSGNDEALATLRAVARRDTGHYYIHCYLGRDRVRVAARALREMGVRVADRTGERADGGYSLARREALSRGPVHVLPDSIYVVPYPDRQEYFTYILNGGVRSVVSVLDPRAPGEAELVEREEEWLEGYDVGIEYRHRPVPLFPPDPCWLDSLAREIRSLPRPVAVHGLDTDFTRSKMVLRALRGQPVYPEDFARGDVTYAGDSIFVGPAPNDHELGDYITTGGLAAVVSLLDPADSAEAARLEEIRRALEGRQAPEGGEAPEGPEGKALIFRSVPVPEDPPPGGTALAGAVDRIRSLPRPVYVHGDRAPEPRTRRLLDALREAGVAARCRLPGSEPISGTVPVVAPVPFLGPAPALQPSGGRGSGEADPGWLVPRDEDSREAGG